MSLSTSKFDHIPRLMFEHFADTLTDVVIRNGMPCPRSRKSTTLPPRLMRETSVWTLDLLIRVVIDILITLGCFVLQLVSSVDTSQWAKLCHVYSCKIARFSCYWRWPPLRACYLAPLYGRLERFWKHRAFLQTREPRAWSWEITKSDR